MKAALYSFHSVWNLAAPRRTVWQALTVIPFSWEQWWPELQEVRDMKVVDGLTGTTFSCVWRSPAGYRLHSDITIGKIIGQRSVVLHAKGDLRGTVTCHLNEADGRTRIEIAWHVETTQRWMNYLAPLLRPLFVHSHHTVMRSGERGLRAHLAAKR